MQTPIVTTVPYCSAASLFNYHDRDQIADFLRDGDDPRPSRAAMLDPASPSGASLFRLLLAACGELESAALAGGRYSPADLQALTDSGEAYLEKLVADLAFWRLAQRRQPGSADPGKVPGAKQALEELGRLRTGERIFGLLETQKAGIPKTSAPDPTGRCGPNVIRRSNRMFGTHRGPLEY